MTTDANRAERDAWDGERGGRWVADPDRRDRVMTSVADALLTAAALTSGEAVLDVGCGCGATTLAAARAVGPSGTVHGIDLSGGMLGVAAGRAAATGLANVSLEQADAQTHALAAAAYDAAISRFGTMFFDDPVAAFTNIARALRPGGRLCIATWQPLLANDWLTVPGAVLLGYGTMPELSGDQPGMFAQSDPQVVASVLERAGFAEIDVRPIAVPLLLGADAREAAAHLADSGVGQAMLNTIPVDQQPAALDAVTTLLAGIADDTGVHLDGAILITTATKPN